MDFHRAINANDIQFMPVYITVKYGESQANSSSHLETQGLQWYGSAKFPVSMDSRTLGHWREGNPVPEAIIILVKILKAIRKFPA